MMADSGASGRLIPGEDYGNLAQLVGYQAGAVVSRTLVKSESGNLTLFAFDQGEGLTEHTTPHEALLWVLEGRVDVEIEGEQFALEAGDFIRLPANIPHAIQAKENMKMGLVLLF